MSRTNNELKRSTSERKWKKQWRRQDNVQRRRGEDVPNTHIRYHDIDKRLFLLTNSIATAAWDPFRARGWKIVEIHSLKDLQDQVFVSAAYRKLIGVATDWDCDNETREVLSRTFHRIFFERTLKK